MPEKKSEFRWESQYQALSWWQKMCYRQNPAIWNLNWALADIYRLEAEVKALKEKGAQR